MIGATTIARPYAQALFSLATEKKEGFADWMTRLDALAHIFSDASILSWVAHPKTTAAQIVETVKGAEKELGTEELSRLLATLHSHQRLPVLPEIAAQYKALCNAQQAQSRAQVRSAFALTEPQIQALTPLIEQRFGHKVLIETEVDPTLIGGVCVSVGDQVWDTSVKAQLERLSQAVKKS